MFLSLVTVKSLGPCQAEGSDHGQQPPALYLILGLALTTAPSPLEVWEPELGNGQRRGQDQGVGPG